MEIVLELEFKGEGKGLGLGFFYEMVMGGELCPANLMEEGIMAGKLMGEE